MSNIYIKNYQEMSPEEFASWMQEQIKKSEQKVSEKYVLQLGHPLTEGTPQEWMEATLIQQGPFNIPADQDPVQFTMNFVRSLLSQIGTHEEVQALAAQGKIAVNLPAFPVALSVALAVIHGQLGHFPLIFVNKRTQDGKFVFDQLLNLENIRQSNRV